MDKNNDMVEKNSQNQGDNRIIADMSHVETRGLFSQWLGILDPNVRAEHGPGRNGRHSQESRNAFSQGGFDNRNMAGGDMEWSKEDRRALLLYTMKYALGIGLVFISILGLVIFLMTKFWN